MEENKDDNYNTEKSIEQKSSENESDNNKEKLGKRESTYSNLSESVDSNKIIFHSDNSLSLNKNKILEESKSEDLNEGKKNLRKSINEIFYLTDLKTFYPDDYKIRKYDKNNFELGKLFFKYRYIKEKIKRLARKSELRMTTSFKTKPASKFSKRFSLAQKKNEQLNMEFGTFKENEEIFKDKSEYRKFNSDFLVLIEKSIFNFNLKKYEESYQILLKENIIKSEIEFGEFLLAFGALGNIS